MIHNLRIRILILIFLSSVSICFSQDGFLNDSKTRDTFSIRKVISNNYPNFGPDLFQSPYIVPNSGVKKRTEYIRRVNQENGTLDPVHFTQILEFDRQGNNTVKMTTWHRCHQFLYEYDTEHKLLRELSTDCDSNVSSVYYYEYDSLGLVIHCSLEDCITYRQHSNNTIHRRDIYDDRINTTWKITYDSINNTNDFKYYSYDSLEFHQQYQYDSLGGMIKSTVIMFPEDFTDVYDMRGKQITSYTGYKYRIFEYYDESNTIQETRISEEGDTLVLKFSYDVYGNVLNIHVDKEDESYNIETNIYAYDDYGNKTEERSYYKDSLRSVTEYQYEYFK